MISRIIMISKVIRISRIIMIGRISMISKIIVLHSVAFLQYHLIIEERSSSQGDIQPTDQPTNII